MAFPVYITYPHIHQNHGNANTCTYSCTYLTYVRPSKLVTCLNDDGCFEGVPSLRTVLTTFWHNCHPWKVWINACFESCTYNVAMIFRSYNHYNLWFCISYIFYIDHQKFNPQLTSPGQWPSIQTFEPASMKKSVGNPSPRSWHQWSMKLTLPETNSKQKHLKIW